VGTAPPRLNAFDEPVSRRADPGKARSPTTGRTLMDALTLLKQDHDKVKGMLDKLDDTTERAEVTRTEGLAKLKQELTVHEAIEEEILYPALIEFAKTKDITLEAFEEHHVVDMIMSELESTPVEDETWAAKLTVMKENLEHHIEEEEDDMFKKARQVMDEAELKELGERMSARKAELQRP
jgi:iron-sulfur cluster repair protein YtfE (RIC family)